MKHFITIALLSVSLVACKSESKKFTIKAPEVKKLKPISLKKNGLKCDVVGNENKEIFLKLEEKDGGEMSANFYDFLSSTKISLVAGHIGEYSLFAFKLRPSAEDENILVGESVMIHPERTSLSDEGDVLSITGRLTLNQDHTGKLEQKLTVLMDDHSVKTTELEEVAQIENCEEFEADSL